MKDRNIALIIISTVFLLGIAVLIAGYFLITSQQVERNEPEITQQVIEIPEDAGGGGTTAVIEVNIEEDSTGTVEYEEDYSVNEDGISIDGTSLNTESCGFEGCFMEKFASCEPAVSTADIGLAAGEHEIFGSEAGGCKIGFKYTRNPNPDWENKYIYCVLNPAMDYTEQFQAGFEGAMEGTGSCYGPLVDVLQAL